MGEAGRLRWLSWCGLVLCIGTGCADEDPSLTAAPGFGAPSPPSVACRAPNPTGEFAVTSIRSRTPTHPGNTWTSVRDAFDRGYRYVEVDVRLTLDGEIVPGRYDDLAEFSTCTGSVRESRMADLSGCEYEDEPGTTLRSMRDALDGAVFDGVYLDLKYTIDLVPEEIDRSVAAVARVTELFERPEVVVAMSYDAGVLAALRDAGYRVGWKGYPTLADAPAFVDEGLSLGAEMVCIRASSLDTPLLESSTAAGIWHLPWESPDLTDDLLITRLVEGGAGGLITDTLLDVDRLVAAHCE